MKTKLFLKSAQNQHCFNVEIYRRINVDKSTLNQHGYHVHRRRDFISTYINVDSTLSVCWEMVSKGLVGFGLAQVFSHEETSKQNLCPRSFPKTELLQLHKLL